MTATFLEVLGQRVATKGHILKAIQADDGSLEKFVEAAEAGQVPVPMLKAAVGVLDRVLGEDPIQKGKQKGKTMPTKLKNQSKEELLAVATEMARKLMAADPKLSLAAARAKVWEQNPELAAAFKAAKPSPKRGSGKPPVMTMAKGESTIRTVEAKAVELRKQDPSLSMARAKTRIWETHPELRDEYERARRS